MSSSKEMEAVEDKTGTMGLPEVFYGNNHLFVSKADKNFLLRIDPVASISLAGFANREAALRKEGDCGGACTCKDDEKIINKIEMIPENITVKEAKIWQKKDTSKI